MAGDGSSDGTERPVDELVHEEEAHVQSQLESARQGDLQAIRRNEREHLDAQASATQVLVDYEQVVDAALAHLDVDDLVEEMLRRTRRLLRVEMAGIQLLEPDGQALRPVAMQGLRDPDVVPERIPVGQWFTGTIIATKQPLVKNAREMEAIAHPLIRTEGLRSLAGVPLVVEGEAFGVLVVGSRSERAFTGYDLRLLQMVADRAALAIDRAKLLDRERERRSKAEQSSQFKTDLLNMAGHDLKSPLSAIKIQAARVCRLRGEPEKLEHAAQVIQKSADKLGLLLDDFLDLARLEAGRFVLRVDTVGLARLMDDVLEAYEGEAQLKSIRLEGDCERALTVRGDGRRLVQVLNNLVGNALRYTPGGGTVRVRGRHDGASIVLEVQDTGEGLSAEQKARLFKPYAQVHGTERVGHGLGLYLARIVAEQHGGLIEVESPGANQGTTVRVVLPQS